MKNDYPSDFSGGIFVALGIIAIVVGEYPIVEWYTQPLGWGIGIICIMAALFLFIRLIDSEFEDDDAHHEDWINPYQ